MQHPSEFTKRVWKIAEAIPTGRVTTYGTIAYAAGGTGQSARSIASILSKHPHAKNLPWHRIVYANKTAWVEGEVKNSRMKLYKNEKIEVDKKGKVINFDEIFYDCGYDKLANKKFKN